MLYLANPSTSNIREAMTGWRTTSLACITTPEQGNVLPEGVPFGADNGKFGKGWPGHDEWFSWLQDTVARYGTGRVLFAVAPDEPFDPELTLAESAPWLAEIKKLGVRRAFAAQNGCHKPGLLPWGMFDVLFLGGGPECLPCGFVRAPKDFGRKLCPDCGRVLKEWKESVAAGRLAREAIDRGLRVHMGRVNTRRRLVIASLFGCHTVDGTTLARWPDTNLPELLRWLDEINHDLVGAAS